MTTQIELSELPRTERAETPPAVPPADERPVTVIRPPSRWQLINVRELWRCRELLYFLAWRDVKVRYKQTVLGAGWAILQPALMMVVFTIFFGRIGKMASEDLPYPYWLFVLVGLLPWTFFATAVTKAANSVVISEELVTKTYFPRLALPFASIGTAIVDALIAFGLMFVLMLWNWDTIEWGPNLLLAVPIFAVIIVMSLGVGTLLAALNVLYRDLRYVIPFMIQLWMFATPTLYMPGSGAQPGPWHWLLTFNPMVALIAAFRKACLGGDIAWAQLGIAAALSAGVFLVGCFYYRKVEDGFVDII